MKYEDWIKELASEDKAHKEFRKKAQKVVDRYEDEEKRGESQSTYNILWSNTEVLHSAVYEKMPTPDIRRRFLDRDPNGKQVAELSERAVSYAMDSYDFDGVIDATVDDYLLPGFGQVRLRYKPYFDQGAAPRIDLEERIKGYDPLTYEPVNGVFNGDEEVEEFQQDDLGPFMNGEPEEELVHEEIACESVNWKRFRWQPASNWQDVDWCSIDHYMTFDELEENYGKELATQIPLGFNDDGEKEINDDEKSRALIHEIFDKVDRKIITIAEGYNEVIKEEDDPLGLEGFYPFPKPLVSTLKNGQFIPIPDFIFYQDQALELDEITTRINLLTKEMKYRGVYDGSFKELADVMTLDDGEFKPIADFQERFQGGQGDVRKAIAAMPLDDIQSALMSLYKAREEVKTTIYEITGIADIMRGSTKSSETLGAQQLKTQFGSMRIAKRQKRVATFIRDIIRLKVEIMVENFQKETLEAMTGIEITPEMEQIFNDDLLRSYRIDIETDSTITADAGQEKQQRIELVTAVTEFAEKVAPLVQQGLMPGNVAKELLAFAVRGFKVGRTLEEVLDEMGGNSQEDPRMQEMQMQMKQQVEQIKQQAGEYVQGVKQQSEGRIKQLEKTLFEKEKQLAISNERTQVKLAESQMKADIQGKALKYKTEMEAKLEVFKAKLDAVTQMPQEHMPDQSREEMNQMMQVLGQALMEMQNSSQQGFNALSGELQSANANLYSISDYMQKPARVVRDANGVVTGATRD